jgi:predicted dehydrogenase
LIDLGVHALDSAWFLMGAPRPVSVSAQVFQNFKHHVQLPVFDVEDSAYGMIRFENGALVQFEISWAANLPDDIPPSNYFGRELINTTLYGPKATIRLNPLTLFEDQNGQLAKVEIEPESGVKAANPFVLQMQNFLDAITGDAKPINTAQQAVYLMEMLDAIYLSSTTGREVPLA